MPPKPGSEMAPTLGNKLRQARLAKGWSTRTVSEHLKKRIQVSHATLANYEKDATLPPVDIIAALSTLYERPINWFLGQGPVLKGVRYRNLKSKVGVRARHQFEGEVQRWLDAYVSIENHLDQPLSEECEFHEPNIGKFEAIQGEPPRETAARLRRELKLNDDDPVLSVVDILEGQGIRSIEIETDLAIHGMAAQLGHEHVIVVTRHTSNDRARLTTAHELGHVLRGDCTEGEESKAEEKAAFEFASHLLLTSSMLKSAFRRKSVVDLVRFKERYGISLAAMVYRAQQEGVIREDEARRLWIAFAKRGWKKSEPGRVIADRPNRFESLIACAIEQHGLTYKSLSKIAGVREDQLCRRIDLALGAEETTDELNEPLGNEFKLRLVH